jgi:small-conductance mechanosensitive channel
VSALRNASLATTRLSAEVDKRRAPLLADLRATLQHGDQLSADADNADPASLPQRTRDIDELTAHFKKVTAALLPLGKLAIVLQSARANFDQWRDVVDDGDGVILRSLMLRVLLLGIAIAAILGASAFWRRATFRYVRDPRRRQQSLLIRRIVVGLALCLMIGFSLATEVGSIATFAGFITAGLAVALQNVILSVAAYFSLIGRYGVRVGDRVQIGGVTGDVMDIGLVRLHVMEVGPDGQQTGRVTAFSNSVLFQPASGFFKQVPGSNFTWHQVRLTLSPKTDYRYAEERLRGAIARVFAGYKDRIVRDHAEMSQNVTIPMGEPGPQSTLRLTDTGLEMTIRYPVPLDSTAAVDDQVTRALLDAVESEPRLRLAGSGTATIQPSPEAAHA